MGKHCFVNVRVSKHWCLNKVLVHKLPSQECMSEQISLGNESIDTAEGNILLICSVDHDNVFIDITQDIKSVEYLSASLPYLRIFAEFSRYLQNDKFSRN